MEAKGRSGAAGFTIVELLVVLAIALVLIGGVYQFFIRQQRGYSAGDQMLRLQQDARVAEDILTKTIQQAGAYSQKDVGTTISMRGQPILAASDHYVTIQYDDPYETAGPGIITAGEVVTFAVSSQKPSAAAAANNWVEEKAGQKTVNVFFDQDGTNGVETDEKFAVTMPLTLKGPPYTLYRVTPDKDAPTDVTKLHAEPIAANVDNLVFRYYDQNGAPIPLDAAGTPKPAPYVLSEAERARVRSVEVEIALRANAPDTGYSAVPIFDDKTVATYDASGTARTYTAYRAALTPQDKQYRRRVFRTRITPRNLAANTYGSITLTAVNAQPTCPTSTEIKAVVQDRMGNPLYRTPPSGNKLVTGLTFRLSAGSGASFAAGSIQETITVDPSSSGEASVRVYYTGTSRSIAVNATAIADVSPTGGPPSVTLFNATSVDFEPGDPNRVVVGTPQPATITTCGPDNSFTFQAQAFDQCGNSVAPTTSVNFEIVDNANQYFGTLTPAGGAPANPAPFTVADQTFTVHLPASPGLAGALAPGTTPPLPASFNLNRDGFGVFTEEVRVSGAPAWWNPHPAFPAVMASVKVRPTPPSAYAWTQSPALKNILTPGLTDCSDPVSDAFGVYDCYGNTVWELTAAQKVAATLTKDAAAGFTDQGALSSAGNTAANNILKSDAATHFFDVTYNPPGYCSMGSYTTNRNAPRAQRSMVPEISVDFGNIKAGLSDGGNIKVDQCADCVVEPASDILNACSGSTSVTVYGCDRAQRTVRLEVKAWDTVAGTWLATRNGSFDSGSTVTTKDVAFNGASPQTATTTLYVGDTIDGDTLRVTASYEVPAAAGTPPGTPKVYDDCGYADIKVSNKCQGSEFKVYANGSSTPWGEAANEDRCVSHLKRFDFKAKACQYALGTNTKVYVYVLTSDPLDPTNSWKIFDWDQVPLQPVLSLGQYGDALKNSIPVNVGTSDVAVGALDDGQIYFPPGHEIYFLFAYENERDTSDQYVPIELRGKTRGAIVSLPNVIAQTDPQKALCQRLVKVSTPVPICFPNAITSRTALAFKGNFNLYWGDAVVTGTVDLPSLVQVVAKSASAPRDGNLNGTDRYFDFYVGHKDATSDDGYFTGYKPAAGTTEIQRPLADLAKNPLGNYFQNIDHLTMQRLARELSYAELKQIAIDQNVYWVAAGNNQIKRPGVGNLAVDVETVLGNPPNGYYVGKFIFIDGFEGSLPADDAQVNAWAAADDALSLKSSSRKLPVFDLQAGFYTEGIVYVAGSLVFKGGGVGRQVPVTQLPTQDNLGDPPGYYVKEASSSAAWQATPADLPIQETTTMDTGLNITLTGINIKGAIYTDGSMDFGGNVSVYGALMAERSFTGAGTPRIWYDFRLGDPASNPYLCQTCQ